jgi:hypothetical protein
VERGPSRSVAGARAGRERRGLRKKKGGKKGREGRKRRKEKEKRKKRKKDRNVECSCTYQKHLKGEAVC